MRIKTMGKLFNHDYGIIGLRDMEVSEWAPSTWRDDDGKEEMRTTPDGRPLYRVPDAKVLRLVDGKADGEVRNVSVNVLNIPDFPLTVGGRYQLDGLVDVNHWFMNGRNGITITADHLVGQALPDSK